jgi:hypothetical protein
MKQSLYAYDFDRTYDLLWAEGISSEILAALATITNWLFTPNLNYMPICLVDRYTPDDLPWANNWADLNYEFLKIISKTHLLDNPQLMGTPAGLDPAITWNRNRINTGFNLSYVPTSVRFTNNRSNPISLTWLELAFNAPFDHGRRAHSYAKRCRIFNKKKLIIKPSESYLLNPVNWVMNSLVISEPDSIAIETEYIEDMNSLLYSELEAELEAILQQLQLTEFRVVSSIDLHIDYVLRFENDSSIGVNNYSSLGLISQISIPSYSNPVYTNIPEWYYFSSLVRANNNPWGEVDGTADKGKPVSVVYENNRLDLKIWNLNYIPFVGSNWPFKSIDDHAVYFIAQGNDYQLSNEPRLNWVWDFSLDENNRYKYPYQYWSGAIGLVDKPENSTLGFINQFSGFNNTFPTSEWFKGTIYKFGKSSFFTTSLHTGRPFIVSPDYTWNSSTVRSRYVFLPTSEYQVLLNNVIGDLYTTQVSVNGCYSDWDQRRWLVQSYSAFLLLPRCQINTYGFFSDGFNFYPSSTAVQKWYATETLFSIDVIHANTQQEVRATRTIETTDDPISVLTLTDWSSGQWTYNSVMGYRREVSKIFTIALQFWETEPEGKDLFTDDQVISIVDAIQLSEAEPDSIVMPDSIRIKEIHAALQADKFSTDPDDPEVLRVANLGYYVERIARVLGISVDPDGSIRSIRQSRLIPAGEEIPAGWPIGQWGRNQGNDRDGQRGGNQIEDRDGTAYEVRSNRFTVNRFTGEADKIESGGYILCENWPQLLHVLLDDLDKGLGWQEAGAAVIPDANNQGRFATYEGLNSLLAEVAYMLSDLSQNIKGGHISGLISQAVLYEVLGAIGLPYNFKSMKVSAEGGKEIHYPALEKESPTLVDLIFLILENLAPLVGSKVNLYPDREENE